MSSGNALEQRIGALIEAVHPAQVAFLAELVRVPSDNPPGDCKPHAVRAAELLEALGFTVERHEVSREFVERHGMRSAVNLIVRHRFGPGPIVALNAHGDVVPPGEGWTSDPYGAEIRNGRMYGRGVAVSKSDFATYAFALKALIDAGARLNGTVELHFTYDEEIGGHVGPGWLLEQGIVKPDYVIAAWFTYSVVIAHNGCLHLEVQVDGRSAHAAKPESGVDALEAATSILSSLYAYRRTLAAKRSAIAGIETPTLVIGLISGGINTNVVPDRVTFRIDRRILPDEDVASAVTDLVAHIEACAAERPDVCVTTREILLAEPLRPNATQARLVDLLQRRARQVTGEDVPAIGVPLFTDARLYSQAGAATVMYGAGPHSILEANGHRADENLALDDLRQATEVIALTIVDLLGG
jgi:acetylornithine deacetylase/succinyl-diaminopimelate desuccinylase family protein